MTSALDSTPSLGRFLSPDPQGISLEPDDPQSWNKYTYVFNRPTTLIDPNGQWPTSYHHTIIEDVFGRAGLNLGQHVITQLENASDWVDSLAAGNQGNDRSFMHAMRDGPDHQTVEQADAATQTYVNAELDAAVSAQILFENDGGRGLSDDALTHFGHALHTETDATSPEHAGYQPWCMECLGQVISHVRRENRSSTSNDAADAEARHAAHVAAARLWARYQEQLRKKREEEERKKKDQKKDPKSKTGPTPTKST